MGGSGVGRGRVDSNGGLVERGSLARVKEILAMGRVPRDER